MPTPKAKKEKAEIAEEPKPCDHRMENALTAGTSEIEVCAKCHRVELSYWIERSSYYSVHRERRSIILNEGQPSEGGSVK